MCPRGTPCRSSHRRLNGAVGCRHRTSSGACPSARELVTSAFVALLANATPNRAHARSRWPATTRAGSASPTARFSGRHLPVAPRARPLPTEARGARAVPAAARAGRRRRPTPRVLFMLFAQWFTDSFLRTDRSDWRKNTSTQEIDFCQIYGLSEPKTRLLRSMEGGRLKSQQIDGQEYPPFLFERTAERRARGQAGVQGPARRGPGCSTSCWPGCPTGRRTSSSPSASSTATRPSAAPRSTSCSCASTTGSPALLAKEYERGRENGRPGTAAMTRRGPGRADLPDHPDDHDRPAS